MIQATYLNEIMQYTKTQISKALVNDSIEITSFNLEIVSENQYEVTFSVMAVDTTQINNIKLCKSDDTVIIDDDVNIPMTGNEAVIRYVLTISEVISA